MSGVKVFIGARLYDAEKEPIILVFETDTDRLFLAHQVESMQHKQGPRFYAQFPAATVTPTMFDDMCEAAKRCLSIRTPVEQLSDGISEEQKRREIKEILDATNALSADPPAPTIPYSKPIAKPKR